MNSVAVDSRDVSAGWKRLTATYDRFSEQCRAATVAAIDRLDEAGFGNQPVGGFRRTDNFLGQ